MSRPTKPVIDRPAQSTIRHLFRNNCIYIELIQFAEHAEKISCCLVKIACW
jgi:hypothetical protein